MWILQTVTLATYVFFIFTVIGRQKLDGIGINMKTERMQSGRLPMDIDIYIPVYTILQFFFYMGLLKVRTRGSKHPRFTTMRNPFQAFVVVQFHPLFVLNPVVIDLYPWNNEVFIKNILTSSNYKNSIFPTERQLMFNLCTRKMQKIYIMILMDTRSLQHNVHQ